jgi:hypothetical protein
MHAAHRHAQRHARTHACHRVRTEEVKRCKRIARSDVMWCVFVCLCECVCTDDTYTHGPQMRHVLDAFAVQFNCPRRIIGQHKEVAYDSTSIHLQCLQHCQHRKRACERVCTQRLPFSTPHATMCVCMHACMYIFMRIPMSGCCRSQKGRGGAFVPYTFATSVRMTSAGIRFAAIPCSSRACARERSPSSGRTEAGPSKTNAHLAN